MATANSTRNLVTVSAIDGEPRVDSRFIAAELGVETKATHQIVDKYSYQFQELGSLPFETEVKKREIGATQEKFYLLNEDQTYFLMTLVRNTEKAVELKKRLVMAFAECRRQLTAAQSTIALPDFTNPAEAARAWALEYERAETSRLELEKAQPMIQFHEEVAQAAAELSVEETCALLFNGTIGPKQFREWLKTNGWMDRRPKMNKPSQWAMKAGYMHMRIDVVRGRVYRVPAVTGNGISLIRHLFRTGELFTATIPVANMIPLPAHSV